MKQFKSAAEMELIRAEDAKVREKQLKEYVPEENKARPVAYLEVDRYYQGQFSGSFIVAQMLTEDAQGKPLKKPVRKVVADGVDIGTVLASLQRVLQQRVEKWKRW